MLCTRVRLDERDQVNPRVIGYVLSISDFVFLALT